MKKILSTMLLMAAMCANAQNKVQTVEQCSDGVTLNEPVDYVITSQQPFATTGSIDIVDGDAVVVFQSLKPSKAKEYLANIKVNGAAATDSKNCWIEIYKNGAIVYPHAELDYHPLTVYTEGGFGGEAFSDFTPYQKHTTGGWVDNFKSFRLKRGYMATIATNPNGQGWSKVFIAQDHDIEIDLTKKSYGKYIADKQGFIRVFPWRNVTKKGTAGNPGLQDELNITWFYGWNGDGWHDDKFEHIPQHHHEGWPSWSGINGLNSCNTVLGNNEPDNQSDKREQYIPVDEIESRMFGPNGTWQNEAYSGGLRVGSPAMSGDCRGAWLSTFMSLCEKYNCRIDFIADHCYWFNNGGNYYWQMDQTYNKYKRPIWITEWNYGANWTNWVSGDKSASDVNQTVERDAVADIVANLESHPHVERYAFYNWVEDCRTIVFDGKLTKAGEWYANLQSNPSYNDDNEYTMGWNYWAPSDLTLTMSKKNATLTWTHLNGKQTNRITIQRKVANEENKWIEIADLGMDYKSEMKVSYTKVTGLNLSDKSGLIYLRIADIDSDGKTRYSNEVTLTLGSGEGTDAIQFGKATTVSAEPFTTEFSETFSETPYVFVGTATNKNAKFLFGNNLSEVSKSKFVFQMLPWQTNTGSMDKSEEIPFLALKPGNYKYGTVDCEVGTAKSAKASDNLWTDITEVTFEQPFAEGVTPVVLTEIKTPGYTKNAPTTTLSVRVFDVTSTGFKFIVYSEEKSGRKVATAQTVNYLAITPGFAYADQENGIMIAAGHGAEQIYGITARAVSFTCADEGEQTQLRLYSPVVLTALQTNNFPTNCTLRRTSDITTDKDGNGIAWTTGVNVKRVLEHDIVVDGTTISTTASSASTAAYRDNIGWVAVAKYREGGSQPADVIDTGIVSANSANGSLQAYMVDGKIKVVGTDDYSIYTASGALVPSYVPLSTGIYIVKSGAASVKVAVK